GNDEVGLDVVFAGELGAHFLADFIDSVAIDDAVGPREIDVFKNAERAFMVVGKSGDAGESVFVDDDNFAGRHIADELRVDQIKRRRLAGKHPRAVRGAANGQRTETKRVARADQFLFRHYDQGIRAFDAAETLHKRVGHAAQLRLREHHDDDFAVHGGLKNEAATF